MGVYPHIQGGIPNHTVEYYRTTGADWGLIMDPGEAPPLPEMSHINWIVRCYQDESLVAEDCAKGGQGAWNQIKRLGDWLRARPYLREARYKFACHNEATNAHILSSAEGREAFSQYGAVFVRLLWEEHGIRACAGQIGVGHPEIEHSVQVFAMTMAELLKYGGIYGVHEYGFPKVQTDWHQVNGVWEGWTTLRYRKWVRKLRAAGMTELPPIAITESGVDGRLVQRNIGWQLVPYTVAEYGRQVLIYDTEIRKDPYIIGQFNFTTAALDPWKKEGYEVTPELTRYYVVNWNVDIEYEEPKESKMVIYDAAGQVRDEAWLRAEYGNVQVEGDVGPWQQIELREDKSGSTATLVALRDKLGNPIPNYLVRCTWPGGGETRAQTKASGIADFGWGSGSYYPVGGQGPMNILVDDLKISGLGWPLLTNHFHLNIVLGQRDVAPVNKPPQPAFSVKVDGSTVALNATGSKDEDGTIVAYRWSFGDGGVGKGRLVTHTYAKYGTFRITLTVTDNDGATAALYKNVTISQQDNEIVEIRRLLAAALENIREADRRLEALM